MSAFAVYPWAVLLGEFIVAISIGFALNAAAAALFAGGPPDRFNNPRWSLKLALVFQAAIFPALCALSFASWRAAAGDSAAAACLPHRDAEAGGMGLDADLSCEVATPSHSDWRSEALEWMAEAWSDASVNHSGVYDRWYLVVLLSYMTKDFCGVMPDRLLVLHHIVCATGALVALAQPAGVRFFLVGTTALELGSGAMNVASLSAKHSRRGKIEKAFVLLSFVIITLSHVVAAFACLGLWRVALPAFFFVWWNVCTWPLMALRQKTVVEELFAVFRRYRPVVKAE